MDPIATDMTAAVSRDSCRTVGLLEMLSAGCCRINTRFHTREVVNPGTGDISCVQHKLSRNGRQERQLVRGDTWQIYPLHGETIALWKWTEWWTSSEIPKLGGKWWNPSRSHLFSPSLNMFSHQPSYPLIPQVAPMPPVPGLGRPSDPICRVSTEIDPTSLGDWWLPPWRRWRAWCPTPGLKRSSGILSSEWIDWFFYR